jgi:hypothetical protein
MAQTSRKPSYYSVRGIPMRKHFRKSVFFKSIFYLYGKGPYEDGV